MNGRLGMTGDGVVRGDKAVGELISKGAVQLTRNGKNVLHLEAANPEHRKIWGAPARMLVVGSGEKRPAGRILLPTRRQWANWGGGAVLAAGGAKAIKTQTSKRDDQRTRRVIGGVAGTAAGTGAALYTHHGGMLLAGIRQAVREGHNIEFKQAKELMRPKHIVANMKENPLQFVTPWTAGWAAGLAIGARRRKPKVAKRDTRRRNTIAGAVAGTAGADLATNVAGWTTREGIKYHEQLVNAGKISHPMSRKARSRRLDEHKAEYGVGSNTKDAPQAYYRNWPDELPGARARRLMGHKNRPAVVAGILGTGAAAGALYGATRKPAQVSKARPLVLPTAGQLKTWGLTGAAGAGAAGLAHHERDRGHRKTAAAAGAGAGVALTDTASGVGGWAAREAIQHGLSQPKNKRTKTTRKILSEHKAKYGVSEGPGKHPPNAYYRNYPSKLPLGRAQRIMGWKNNKYVIAGGLTAAGGAGALIAGRKKEVASKVDTTMSEREAKQLADRYDTRGPLPKGLTREQKMKAYEARYVASGGKKGEVWHRRANAAEVTRNVGLAGATLSGAALLATRGKKVGPRMARVHLTPHRVEGAALGSGVLGGAAELAGEHARNRQASYSNTPAGVAGSALSRMRAYTPGGPK
jgi:hypothetical protein